MSVKIALVLLICSCVVLGLAYADSRQQQRHPQRIQQRYTQQLHKGTVNSKRRTVPQEPDTEDPQQNPDDFKDYEMLDESRSTNKPLATYIRDNIRPNH